MKLSILVSTILAGITTPSWSFLQAGKSQHWRFAKPLSSTYDVEASSMPTEESLSRLKADLLRSCGSGGEKADEIISLVKDIEDAGELLGIGQTSALSGLLSGEWELVYSSEDDTRSSPFFWAFRKAFPDNSDQIFGITDAIPSPIKEVGPAFQQIDLNDATQTGRFISRVKVATFGGVASSIMTTRASIVGIDGLDGIRLKIETTKPEKSTLVSTLLGPLGDVVNENSPAFPSGEALERVRPGSSEVVIRNTYCDEGLRISRNDERSGDIYIWRRREFADYDFL